MLYVLCFCRLKSFILSLSLCLSRSLTPRLRFPQCVPQVDIVLPQSMDLKTAHDIGEGLQHKVCRRLCSCRAVFFSLSSSLSFIAPTLPSLSHLCAVCKLCL